jgi:hypothetical protein
MIGPQAYSASRFAPESDDDRPPSRDRYELRTHDDRVTARHVALGDLPTRQVVALDWPHPPVELLSVASWLGATSSSSAVPPTCPMHRFAAVIHGQPRFIPMPFELEDRPVPSGPRELPKLAVLQGTVRRRSRTRAGRLSRSGHAGAPGALRSPAGSPRPPVARVQASGGRHAAAPSPRT